uniref:uncharacterized protein LOC122605646 n=1 Tax=Erigeron canadensis TaxID=72917 RepID=UPI001CB8C718|nr:uncharacterized protein LOC122605646 [Erigeron canadensis]
MSEYIPLEVQEKILNRLPVKPLVQFRSVSKIWKSLIDSPEFIAVYGVRETHPNRLILTYKDGQTQSRFLIMSFDLTAKELKEINLTGSLTNPLCRIHTISKLRESLVLLAYHREFEADVSVCCLWMMKVEGDSRSFTKLHTINWPDATIKTLLGFRKTGELIVETQYQNEENSQLEIYNPNSNATDNLGIDGDGNSSFMCSYMETLLLLDQLDGFIYSSVTIPSPSTNPRN